MTTSANAKNKLFKALIAVLLIDALSIAGWWYFYQKLSGMSGRVAVLREEAAATETKQKNIKRLTQTLEDISDKKSKIDSVFVDEKAVIRLIEDLEKSAGLSGVSLKISSVSLPANSGGDGPKFNLNLGGSFGQLFKFLSLLENMNYQLKVETANFQAGHTGAWSSQINLRLLSYVK